MTSRGSWPTKLRMSSPVNFLIIHGTRGNPHSNWFPWLAKKLEAKGRVFVPTFPTPQGQYLDNWVKIAESTIRDASPADTIIIAHSIGPACALRLAERAKTPFKSLFLVCPFLQKLGLQDYDPPNETFIRHLFDWKKVKAGAKKIICLAGDNDPYVPLAYSKGVADKAAASLRIIEKGGHLNSESGYSEFPLLLDLITQEVNA